MRSTEVTSLPIQEQCTSIDPRRLEYPAPQHTYSNHFDFMDDSPDESFLASAHLMKHSSSSSPIVMDASADYLDANGQNGYTDFQLFGEEYIQEEASSLRQAYPFNKPIIPSIETEVAQPCVQHSAYTAAEGSPSHSNLAHEPTAHSYRSMVPEHTRQPPRGAARLRTPQISISTDVGHSRMATDVNGNHVITSDEEPARSYSGRSGVSPSVVLTMWEEPGSQLLAQANQFQSPMDGITPSLHEIGYFSSQHLPSNAVPRVSDGSPAHAGAESLDDEVTGRNTKVPRRRQSLPSGETKNLKEQAREAELEARCHEVAQWVANEIYGTAAAGSPSGSSSTTNTPASAFRDEPRATEKSSPSQVGEEPDDSANIRPVSPTPSVRKNKVVAGQNYINPEATNVSEADLTVLTSGRRQFEDAPAVLSTSSGDDEAREKTAIDMMIKYNAMSDNMSVVSRQATWGTTRLPGAPSIADIESITGGGLLKRLSLSRGADDKHSLMTKFGNFVRKNSTGNRRKRNRSDAGIGPHPELASDIAVGSAASTEPPRAPSATRGRPRMMQGIETNNGDHLVPPSHSRRKSTGGASPASSVVDFFHVSRSRSKSDVPPLSEIAQQWRAHGGPYVVIPSPRDDDNSNNIAHLEYSDADGEGDDDDEEDLKYDESLAPNFDLTIVPTTDGYKANIRALNPSIPEYLCDRLAHDQSVRYKGLLDTKIQHEAHSGSGACPSADLCIYLGNPSKSISPKAKAGRNLRATHHDDGSDTNPENKLGPENFPSGIPMPPTDKFPARLECPFCFKLKNYYKPSDWTKHVQEDISPFTCTWPGCKDAKSFKRKADYVRHENEKHRHLESWNCNYEGCTHVCYRKDNFQNHLVREHGKVEPKARSKAQIQNASGYDRDFWQIVSSCYRQSGANAANEPCRFCRKTFTTFKKLTGHQAKHMEQIALPILRLVKKAQVDESTIISPIGPAPTNQQPETPAVSMPHFSPYSQGRSSNNISPGAHDMEPFPAPLPHSMQHTAGMRNNPNRFVFQFPSQPQNFAMMNPVPGHHHGTSMSPATSSMSFDSRYNSASPAQHNMSYGEGGGLASHLGNMEISNQPAQYQNLSHGASSSMSHSYGSSMVDPTSPMDLPMTTVPYSGFVPATMSLPMSSAPYSSSIGMPTSAAQGQHGLPANRFFGEIDPNLGMMDPTFNGLGQPLNYGAYADDIGMQRSHSNPNSFGMHAAQQQQFAQNQVQRGMWQQRQPQMQQYQGNSGYGHVQQGLGAQLPFQGSRARSTSVGRTPPGWEGGMLPNSYIG